MTTAEPEIRGSEGADPVSLAAAHEEGLSAAPDEQIDDHRGDEDDVGEPIRYTIMSYGADLPVDTLLTRLEKGRIKIPGFQRGFVWKLPQASRFIESLLLGLPVPELFFFKDPETKVLQVVDGQQRLVTLKRFFDGKFGNRGFRLTGVASEFEGKTIETLDSLPRRQLEQALFHATIFEQIEPSDGRSCVYSVFERLNTGGTPLQAQEIRSSIYQGPLNDCLERLAREDHWRRLYGSVSPRKRDQEIILRWLALLHSLEEYKSPMKRFLNDFMERRRDPGDEALFEYEREFRETVRQVDEALGPESLRPDRALNVAVADAVLVGVALRLRAGPVASPEAFRDAHRRLMDRLRSDELYQNRTTHTNRLRDRIAYARDEYSRVP